MHSEPANIQFTIEDFIIPNQYGFRQGGKTTDCLVDLLMKLLLHLITIYMH